MSITRCTTSAAPKRWSGRRPVIFTSPSLMLPGGGPAVSKLLSLSFDAYFATYPALDKHRSSLGEIIERRKLQTPEDVVLLTLDEFRRVKHLNSIRRKSTYLSRIGLIEALKSPGYEVRFVAADYINYTSWLDENLMAKATAAGASEIIKVGATSIDDWDFYPPVQTNAPADVTELAWVKDVVRQVGDVIFYTPRITNKHLIGDICNGVGQDTRFVESNLGIGGMSFVGEDFALVPDIEAFRAVRGGRAGRHFLRRMERDLREVVGISGNRVLNLPPQKVDLLNPWQIENLGIRARVVTTTEHVDWEAIVHPDGTKLAFSRSYFEANRDRLKRIADALNAEHVTIWPDISTFWVNPVVFPDGSLLFNAAAQSLEEVFTKDGWTLHFTAQEYDSFGDWGGPGCASSVLWFPESAVS